MSDLRPQRSRRGALGVLIVIIIALAAGAVIGTMVLSNRGVAGLREQIDTLIGPSPVKGNVISVKSGSDRNQPSYALATLDEPAGYKDGDTFIILQAGVPVAKAIVQSLSDKGQFTLRVDQESWLTESPGTIKKGDDVRARRIANNDGDPSAE